jgi:hypothetical protein
MGRILIFNPQGDFLRAFGAYGSGASEIGIVGGITIDAQGNVWVSDALNNRLMRFTLPDLPTDVDTLDNQSLEDGDNTNLGGGFEEELP